MARDADTEPRMRTGVAARAALFRATGEENEIREVAGACWRPAPRRRRDRRDRRHRVLRPCWSSREHDIPARSPAGSGHHAARQTAPPSRLIRRLRGGFVAAGPRVRDADVDPPAGRTRTPAHAPRDALREAWIGWARHRAASTVSSPSWRSRTRRPRGRRRGEDEPERSWWRARRAGRGGPGTRLAVGARLAQARAAPPATAALARDPHLRDGAARISDAPTAPRWPD